MNTAEIIAARTWGALGNYLAASNLAEVLERRLSWKVNLREIETLVPWAAESGRRIADICSSSGSPEVLHRSYMQFADEALRLMPDSYEVHSDAAPIRLDDLLDCVQSADSGIFIGTKGVVSRMLTYCVRRTKSRSPIWNYVTNPGLFEMGMHRAPYSDFTTVPFIWNKERLLEISDVRPEQVYVTGPLLRRNLSNVGPTAKGAADSLPLVVVFNNRCGAVMSRLVCALAEQRANCDVVYIALDENQTQLDRVRRLASERQWEVYEKLPQSHYFEYLERAATTPGSCVVAKASPATVFEVVSRNIPLVTVSSGLPQEDWVPEMIRSWGLGSHCRTTADLLVAVQEQLNQRENVHYRRLIRSFTETHLDQNTIESRIEIVASAAARAVGR